MRSRTPRPSTRSRAAEGGARGRRAAAALPAERLHKVLARLGLGSRREVEGWIAAGRVTVNGATAGLGARVGPLDRICVDGRRIARGRPAGTRVLAYHKREGEISARPRGGEARPSVYDRLPRLRRGRWIGVGRLDVNSQGLLLFTNRGELAHRLMHPSFGVEREYAVRVLGAPDAAALRRLETGVELDGSRARFESIAAAGGAGANRWFRVVLTEGRHREVRRLWGAVGITVSRLIRIRYGPVALPRDVRAGAWRELGAAEVEALLAAVGLSAPARTPAGGTAVRGRRRRARTGPPPRR